MSGFVEQSSDNPLDWLNETSAVLAYLNDVTTNRAASHVAPSCEWRLTDEALYGQYLILERCRQALASAVRTLETTHAAQLPTMPA